MFKVNIVLLVVVVCTGLYAVQVQYDARRLYTALDRARLEQQRLESENDRLAVEKRAEATSLRVEGLAKEKLKMQLATPATTMYISGAHLPAPAAADVGAPAGAGAVDGLAQGGSR